MLLKGVNVRAPPRIPEIEVRLILLAHFAYWRTYKHMSTPVHRNQVKTLFLTYPQCPLTRERVLEHLNTIDTVKEYVVAKEFHQDGAQHLHVYIKFQTGLRTTEFTPTLDVDGHHGNYQAVRSFRCVVKYVTKDNDYITNMSAAQLETPQAKRAKLVEDIKDKSVKELLETGVISINQLRNVQLAKTILTASEPYEHDDVRGVWIYGPPRTGKSTRARTEYGGPVYTVDIPTKWMDGYAGEPVILLDDFDDKWPTIWGFNLKRWADKFACIAEVKGGTVQLRHKHLIVTSNYSLEDMFRSDLILQSAIKRRFTIVRTTI